MICTKRKINVNIKKFKVSCEHLQMRENLLKELRNDAPGSKNILYCYDYLNTVIDYCLSR